MAIIRSPDSHRERRVEELLADEPRIFNIAHYAAVNHFKQARYRQHYGGFNLKQIGANLREPLGVSDGPTAQHYSVVPRCALERVRDGQKGQGRIVGIQTKSAQ